MIIFICIMKFERYESRFKAGEILSKSIKETDLELYKDIIENNEKYFCFAIPNGGVPVSEGFCSVLNIKYDLLIVRKIKIPWNTEAGFGSVTTDGTILINEPLLKQLSLSEQELNNSINLTKDEIRERLEFYKKSKNLEELYNQNIRNKNIFIVDDGLASGFTMLAAIKMIKKYTENIFIAIPTAPLRTVEVFNKQVKKIFCPNIRNVLQFAVADAYKKWYDLPDSEVKKIIESSKYYKSV